VFEENRSTTEKAVSWLQSQAAAQSKQLTENESELAEFRARNNLDMIEGQKATVQQSIETLSSSAAGIENKIVLLEEMRVALKTLETYPNEAEAVPSEIPRGAAIVEVVDALRNKQAERRALAARYTAEHPDMKALDAQIAVLEAGALEKIRTVRHSIGNDIVLLRQQSESLQERMVSEQKKQTDFERQLVETRTQLTTMERERDACDIVYRGILNRIEEARLSADENTAIVKLVEAADVPGSPLRQKQRPFMLFGLLLGLVGGAGLALVSDTLEDRVTSLAAIEQGVGVKVIGVVPHVPRIQRAELAPAGMNHKHGQLTEAFAGIRSVLNSPQYKEHSKSILIVSSAPEEGKTIVSSNLAIGSAKSGMKTLLVDFDMRRPRLPSIFGRPAEGSSLLKALGEGVKESFPLLPMPTECENLHVITTRSTDEGNPSEIISGQIIGEFFEWANEHYDRIVVDSPPFGIVSDSAVLATVVQSVILICRPERTRRRNSRHAVRHFTEMGANVIGAVVNDVDFGKRSYFSSGAYYQHPYHYRHRYGDYYTSKLKKKDKKSKGNSGESESDVVEKD